MKAIDDTPVGKPPMKYCGLELGSGSAEVSRAFRDAGWHMTTCDNDPDVSADLWDWEELDPDDWTDLDFIWWSPDCSVYSTMSFPKGHFNNGIAMTDEAKAAERSNLKVICFIMKVKPRWLIIENPRALMRTRPWIEPLFERRTITQCQYGSDRMKPTDLFGRFPTKWEAKACKNGAPCHIAAPRGSKTGTQGRDRKEVAKIPYMLAISLAHAMNQEARLWG